MIYQGKTQVTTAGTAVPLSTVPIKAAWILLYPATTNGSTNTGDVRIGGAAINPSTGAYTFPPTSIPAGTGLRIDKAIASPVLLPSQAAPNALDLSQIYIDATNSGDGVQYIWSAT